MVGGDFGSPGVTNVAHQVGGSLGLAILVAVLAAAGSSTLHGSALLAHRISAALTVGAVLHALSLAVALVVHPHKAAAVEGVEQDDMLVGTAAGER